MFTIGTLVDSFMRARAVVRASAFRLIDRVLLNCFNEAGRGAAGSRPEPADRITEYALNPLGRTTFAELPEGALFATKQFGKNFFHTSVVGYNHIYRKKGSQCQSVLGGELTAIPADAQVFPVRECSS